MLSLRKVDPSWLFDDSGFATQAAQDWLLDVGATKAELRAAATPEERKAIQKTAQSSWLKFRRAMIKDALKGGRVVTDESKLYKPRAKKIKPAVAPAAAVVPPVEEVTVPAVVEVVPAPQATVAKKLKIKLAAPPPSSPEQPVVEPSKKRSRWDV